MILRRNFLVGLFSGIVAAPAIVRASSLMPIRGEIVPLPCGSTPPGSNFRVPGVPRCEICHKAFGMCAHTGGPISYTNYRTLKGFSYQDDRLDSRVVELDPAGGLRPSLFSAEHPVFVGDRRSPSWA